MSVVMGITALPTDTIRVIGSTQCLTDPASMVKELVENALDADATAVFVEISPNTMNKIKVKDNGHGIVPKDRSLVCKRYCTSKITSFEDLQTHGGRSLGFRGEALASAAEMSTKIVLITRVEGEPTAVEIHYDRAGSATSEKPTSHAVGTTIEVHNFLSKYPVRKQSAEKASSKCLSRVKKLLQSYALARPCVRLSLKVLKAKDDRGDWSYAPKSGAKDNASLKSATLDAAINVFGRKAVEQLRSHTVVWSSIGELIDPPDSELSDPEARLEDRYIFDFLLVKHTIADTAVVNNLGQHISIDDRPVSCCRGMLKEISYHYRKCLKSAICGNEDGKILDPLLILNVRCPRGSYDINVDPAKNDIVFTDSGTFLQIFQKSLNSVYGGPEIPLEKRSPSKSNMDSSTFDVLLASKAVEKASTPSPKPSPLANSETLTSGVQSDVLGSGRANRIISQREMLSLGVSCVCSSEGKAGPQDPDDIEHHQTCPVFHEAGLESASEQEDLGDINIVNPWSLAMIHAPSRQTVRQDANQKDNAANGYLPTPLGQRGDVTNDFEISSDDLPPRQSTSPVPFPYPIKAFGKRQLDDTVTRPSESSATTNSRLSALDTWLNRSASGDNANANVHGDTQIFGDSDATSRSGAAAGHSRTYGTALADIPDGSQRPPPNQAPRNQGPNTINKPLSSAANDQQRVWFEIGEHSHSYQSKKRPTKDKPRRKSINLRDEDDGLGLTKNIIHPDLALALEYEARKAKATQDHREHLRKEQAAAIARKHAELGKQRTLDSLFAPPASSQRANRSPHKNRQKKAVAALHSNTDTPPAEFAEEVVLPYAETGQPPPSRRRSSKMKLPLEKVKEQDRVSDLVLPLSMTQAAIMDKMQAAVDWDDYVHTGEHANGLDQADVGLLKVWEWRIRQLIGERFMNGDPHVDDGTAVDEEDVVVLDLGRALLRSRSEDT